jgi:hypothetical protein
VCTFIGAAPKHSFHSISRAPAGPPAKTDPIYRESGILASPNRHWLAGGMCSAALDGLEACFTMAPTRLPRGGMEHGTPGPRQVVCDKERRTDAWDLMFPPANPESDLEPRRQGHLTS